MLSIDFSKTQVRTNAPGQAWEDGAHKVELRVDELVQSDKGHVNLKLEVISQEPEHTGRSRRVNQAITFDASHEHYSFWNGRMAAWIAIANSIKGADLQGKGTIDFGNNLDEAKAKFAQLLDGKTAFVHVNNNVDPQSGDINSEFVPVDEKAYEQAHWKKRQGAQQAAGAAAQASGSAVMNNGAAAPAPQAPETNPLGDIL